MEEVKEWSGYKLGDNVLWGEERLPGVVICFGISNNAVGVDFEKWAFGHNLEGRLKGQSGQWLLPSQLRLITGLRVGCAVKVKGLSTCKEIAGKEGVICFENPDYTYFVRLNGAEYLLRAEELEVIKKRELNDEKLSEKAEKYSKILENYPQVLKDRIRELSGKVDLAVRQNMEWMRECANLQTYFRSLSAKKIDKSENIRLIKIIESDCEKLEFGVENAVVSVVTNEVILHYKDKAVNLGRFNISITINGEVKIQGEKNVMGYCHPHVPVDGRACFGTYEKKILDELAANRFLTAMVFLIDFVNSCYSDGWFQHIYFWLPAGTVCLKCFEDIKKCKCSKKDGICFGCGKDLDDCVCLRCPETDEVLGHGAFPDNECFNCVKCIVDKGNGVYRCGHSDGGFETTLTFFDIPGDSEHHRYQVRE